MLDLLDELQDQRERDLKALTFMAHEVLYKPGFLTSFVSNQEGNRDQPFLVSRATLAALLITAKFDEWQMRDHLELAPDAALDARKIDVFLEVDRFLDLKETLTDEKWMRIVDLGMEKSGFSKWTGPRSTTVLDDQKFKMNVALVVDFIRSARFMSWDEDSWTQPESIQAMNQVIRKKHKP